MGSRSTDTSRTGASAVSASVTPITHELQCIPLTAKICSDIFISS
ncbi:Uncharacterised protein [Mycobacteroides abscessus subsp. abscessus]|nr:Uncharacterised protein [Mycobacteroides abscessus subsp. abscessus]